MDPVPMLKRRQAQTQLLSDVFGAIRRGRLLQPGDSVGVCVSGGADSVALLLLLIELQEKLGVVLGVVHFNHQLRGKQSDSDENFVAKLAAKYDLPLHVGRENVAAKAKREKANLEDAGRRARYGFFARLVEEQKLTRLAVAHTADDQAETVLAHILRGTGLAGLGGIHPTSSPIVRPLLQIRRATLRVYLKDRKQSWREDATNRDTSKMRARIRKKLLPLLEKQFQPATVQHLSALANFAREDNACLDFIAASSASARCNRENGAISIDIPELLTSPQVTASAPAAHDSPGPRVPYPLGLSKGGLEPTPPQTRAITRRIIRQIIHQAKPQAGQLTATHVDAILHIAEHGENGKSLPLPGGMEVRREHDKLLFRAIPNIANKNKIAHPAKEFEHHIDFSGTEAIIRVPCLACVFRLRMIDWPPKRGETSTTGPVLDRHALRLPLVLRNWRPGDRLRPAGHRNAHKLKRLLNEQRVSPWEREGWPVLTSAGSLVWARGFPVAPEFAANDSTRVGVLIAEEKIS
jgi:tRNA(Ile)-lysidine synthase